MRIGDLTIGDVFYIPDNPKLGPLLRNDDTSDLATDLAIYSFVSAESLNMRGTVYLMPPGSKVIKVGRLEAGDNHDN